MYSAMLILCLGDLKKYQLIIKSINVGSVSNFKEIIGINLGTAINFYFTT